MRNDTSKYSSWIIHPHTIVVFGILAVLAWSLEAYETRSAMLEGGSISRNIFLGLTVDLIPAIFVAMVLEIRRR